MLADELILALQTPRQVPSEEKWSGDILFPPTHRRWYLTNNQNSISFDSTKSGTVFFFFKSTPILTPHDFTFAFSRGVNFKTCTKGFLIGGAWSIFFPSPSVPHCLLDDSLILTRSRVPLSRPEWAKLVFGWDKVSLPLLAQQFPFCFTHGG